MDHGSCLFCSNASGVKFSKRWERGRGGTSLAISYWNKLLRWFWSNLPLPPPLPPTFQFCEVKAEHQPPMGRGSDQSELLKPFKSQHLQCQVLTWTAELFGRSLVPQGRAQGHCWGTLEMPTGKGDPWHSVLFYIDVNPLAMPDGAGYHSWWDNWWRMKEASVCPDWSSVASMSPQWPPRLLSQHPAEP